MKNYILVDKVTNQVHDELNESSLKELLTTHENLCKAYRILEVKEIKPIVTRQVSW